MRSNRQSREHSTVHPPSGARSWYAELTSHRCPHCPHSERPVFCGMSLSCIDPPHQAGPVRPRASTVEGERALRWVELVAADGALVVGGAQRKPLGARAVHRLLPGVWVFGPALNDEQRAVLSIFEVPVPYDHGRPCRFLLTDQAAGGRRHCSSSTSRSRPASRPATNAQKKRARPLTLYPLRRCPLPAPRLAHHRAHVRRAPPGPPRTSRSKIASFSPM